MKPTTEEEERIIRERDHRGMILNDQLWPQWPVLFMKNPTKECPITKTKPMTGLMASSSRTIVFVGPVMFTDWKNAQTMEYSSVDTLLADGWQVD
jgi:hypothetical protein